VLIAFLLPEGVTVQSEEHSRRAHALHTLHQVAQQLTAQGDRHNQLPAVTARTELQRPGITAALQALSDDRFYAKMWSAAEEESYLQEAACREQFVAPGLTTVPEIPDGACLFRALARRAYRNAAMHYIVRLLLAAEHRRTALPELRRWLRTGPRACLEVYTRLATSQLLPAHHLANLETFAGWGDSADIAAFETVYSIGALVWTYNVYIGEYEISEAFVNAQGSAEPVRLAHRGCHFTTLVVDSGSSSGTAASPARAQASAAAPVAPVAVAAAAAAVAVADTDSPSNSGAEHSAFEFTPVVETAAEREATFLSLQMAASYAAGTVARTGTAAAAALDVAGDSSDSDSDSSSSSSLAEDRSYHYSDYDDDNEEEVVSVVSGESPDDDDVSATSEVLLSESAAAAAVDDTLPRTSNSSSSSGDEFEGGCTPLRCTWAAIAPVSSSPTGSSASYCSGSSADCRCAPIAPASRSSGVFWGDDDDSETANPVTAAPVTAGY
jgi:hypothetical protein